MTTEDMAARLLVVGVATLTETNECLPMLAVDRGEDPLAFVTSRPYDPDEQQDVLVELSFLAAAARGESIALALDSWTRGFATHDELTEYRRSGLRPEADPLAGEALEVYAVDRSGERTVTEMKYHRADDGSLGFDPPTRSPVALGMSPPIDALDVCLYNAPGVSLAEAARLLSRAGHAVVIWD